MSLFLRLHRNMVMKGNCFFFFVTGKGEPLNKEVDNSFYAGTKYNIDNENVHGSIAFIDTSKSTGTGYRVGTEYLMTAFHVISPLYGK